MKQTTIDNITKLINDTNYLCDIDFEQFLTLEQEWDTEEFHENLLQTISEYEVIYYNNAMAILTEHDTSLYNCLELVSDYGYQLTDLNSEVLATLLMQQIMIEELNELDFEQYTDPADHE